MIEENYLQKFNEVEAKTQLFLSKMRNCLATGKGLMNDGAALVASYKEIQLARQKQEQEFKTMMANLDERSRRFDQILPDIQAKLNNRMESIKEIRGQIFNLLQNGVSNEGERYACDSVLRMLEMEHQAYFSELDRLLYL